MPRGCSGDAACLLRGGSVHAAWMLRGGCGDAASLLRGSGEGAAWMLHGCGVKAAWMQRGCRVDAMRMLRKCRVGAAWMHAWNCPSAAWMPRGCRVEAAWMLSGCRVDAAWELHGLPGHRGRRPRLPVPGDSGRTYRAFCARPPGSDCGRGIPGPRALAPGLCAFAPGRYRRSTARNVPVGGPGSSRRGSLWRRPRGGSRLLKRRTRVGPSAPGSGRWRGDGSGPVYPIGPAGPDWELPSPDPELTHHPGAQLREAMVAYRPSAV